MTYGRGGVRLQCECLETRDVPSSAWDQTFESVPPGAIPAGWQQWSSASADSFSARIVSTIEGVKALTTAGSSALTSRAWHGDVLPADSGVSAYVYVDGLQPFQIIARGRNLAGATPTFYGVQVTRGLEAQLVKAVDGVTTVLATIRSTDYVSGKWIRVTLRPEGNRLAVELYRADTGKYLTAAGQWQTDAASAIQLNDDAISGGGNVGFNRPGRYAATVLADDFRVIVPATNENFDSLPVGTLPSAWMEWASAAAARFRTAALSSQSAPNSFASTSAASNAAARAWLAAPLPRDVQVTASVLTNTLVPLRLIARGAGLNTATPSYYSLSVTRGLEVKLLRVVNGVTTELAAIRSTSYFSNQWVRVSLQVTDQRVQAIVFRADTGQYLDAAGNWRTGLTRALDVQDGTISAAGFAGVERPALYGGTVTLDDFEAAAAGGDSTAPTVSIQAPTAGSTLTGTVTVAATASDNGPIEHVEFLVDGVLRYSTARNPYEWRLDTTTLENGTHVITVRAYDMAGNIGQAAVTVTTQNNVLPRPGINRHYTHIRVAALAYHGTPMTEFEKTLLRNSIDLVVPHPMFLAQINNEAPDTPQLVYSNVSNLYENLLTDWLTYADAHGLDRELAFYHAAQAAAWSHGSASSVPVRFFWAVRRGADATTTTNYTGASRDSAVGDVPFGPLGQSVYIGYPERFREINFNFFLGGSNGWQGVLEYATAVDAAGRPTQWSTLPTLTDTTNGFARSGRVEFDPPPEWKTATVSGSAPLFYVRIRTTSHGNPPVATTIHGRNYSNSNGASVPVGTTPVFDFAADVNADGYLNNAEYAQRAQGKDARFVYESRIQYPYYGEMRLALNPTSPEVREWAADYHLRFLQANPLADGFFMDNSAGRLTLGSTVTMESTASYTQDYAAMLGEIGREIFPRFLAVNTSNGGPETDAVIRAVPVWIEEFAIRALAHNYSQFLDLAAMVQRRQALKSPSAYAVIDSLPTNGSRTDPRTQLATLAYYYLIGDPNDTMLMFFGGDSPSSSWTEHWTQAAAFDVGQPQGAFSQFAEGTDPSNAALSYKVYQRRYDNALVLYKPLSYRLGSGTGTTASNTATTHQLGGSYRVLTSLGTLSAPVTSISLRNGEGAILIPV